MKNTILNFLLIVCIQHASTAQYSKIIVQLKDKGTNSFSISNPASYLSARSITRRTRYNIAIDSFDLPVTQRYIDSIRLAGSVTILSTSKWLNQVLIQTTDAAALSKINSFPFVKSSMGVSNRPAQTVKDKFKEDIIPLETATTAGRTLADTFNYGSNYSQVHIHEGEFLHNKGFQGQNVQITVLDAGFLQYRSLTAFDSVRMNGQILGERDFVAFDNSVNEDDSHGMYCLSTMATNWPGRMVGTAPKSNYWLVRTENAPSEFPIEEHNWAVGAEFADSTGSDLISSSLGYFDFDDHSFDHTYADFYKNATMVSRAATQAAKRGMIVMNSAGNEGSSAWKYIGFPADADSVCAVGAVTNAGNIASFSSYGYPGKVKPNIVSVGQGTIIAGFNNQPSSGNGTSFACPNIAGLVACLWQAFPRFNNMKILDAVYKSADKYATPDNRYGFGIPNFKTAYRSLKKEENTILFGNEWLFASPDPFTSQIDAKFIGQVDGAAKLELLNSTNQVLFTQLLTTEKEEVYNYTFQNLGSLPGGNYIVRYSDGATSRSVALQKATNLFTNDWLRVLPIPFYNELKVYVKAPESGKASLRILNALGQLVDKVEVNLTQGNVSTINFTNLFKLQRGIYFLEYTSDTQHRTVKLLKL